MFFPALGIAKTSTFSPLPISLKYSRYLEISAVADIKTTLEHKYVLDPLVETIIEEVTTTMHISYRAKYRYRKLRRLVKKIANLKPLFRSKNCFMQTRTRSDSTDLSCTSSRTITLYLSAFIPFSRISSNKTPAVLKTILDLIEKFVLSVNKIITGGLNRLTQKN